LILYSSHLISNRVNLANTLCKITFSKFSVKSFLAKPWNDHVSDLTALSQHTRTVFILELRAKMCFFSKCANEKNKTSQ